MRRKVLDPSRRMIQRGDLHLILLRRTGFIPSGHQLRCQGRVIVLAALALAFSGNWSLAADRLVLRNLEVISDRTVVSFDENGVVLDNGARLGWEEIEAGSVAQHQAEFDRMVRELGQPLFRIRQRLAVGDLIGLAQPTEALWSRYRSSRGPVAYRVAVSLMWARLAAGRREEAAVPAVWAIENRRHLLQPSAELLSLPGKRRPQWDAASGLLLELLPVAWDPSAAARVLEELGATIGQMEQPWPPAARIYYATMAAAAQRFDRAYKALDTGDSELATWLAVVQLQEALATGQASPAVAQLETRWRTMDGAERIALLYWLGRYFLQQPNPSPDHGLVRLVRLAAELEPNMDAEPAASALELIQEELKRRGDMTGSARVRAEILKNFGHTQSARRLQDIAR